MFDINILAAGGLPKIAPTVFEIPLPFPSPFDRLDVNNSMLPAWAVAIALIIFAQVATKNPKMIPAGLQNFAEWVIESLMGLLEGVLGKDLTKKTLWFFATVFIFILTANWFALFPGVGSIGMGYSDEKGYFHVTEPFIRGANADVNMTLAMALVFFGLWTYWSLQANGIGGFVHHIFGSKANMPGFMGLIMAVVFIAVGIIEVISILFRPVSLTFRLYGNIYGGEFLLEEMIYMNMYFAWIIPLPFYFFELLVGVVQALVFCLLTAVFTGMMCQHHDHHPQTHGDETKHG